MTIEGKELAVAVQDGANALLAVINGERVIGGRPPGSQVSDWPRKPPGFLSRSFPGLRSRGSSRTEGRGVFDHAVCSAGLVAEACSYSSIRPQTNRQFSGGVDERANLACSPRVNRRLAVQRHAARLAKAGPPPMTASFASVFGEHGNQLSVIYLAASARVMSRLPWWQLRLAPAELRLENSSHRRPLVIQRGRLLVDESKPSIVVGI